MDQRPTARFQRSRPEQSSRASSRSSSLETGPPHPPRGRQLVDGLFDPHAVRIDPHHLVVARLGWLCQLRDNDWIVDREVEDLECAPRKASLWVRAAALDAELSISFQRAEADVGLERATRIARAGHREMQRRMEQQLANAPPDFRASIAAHGPEETGERSAKFLLDGIAVEDSALCVIEGSLRWPIGIVLEPFCLRLTISAPHGPIA